MIPDSSPNLLTGSPYAEPKVYKYLREQLANEYTVIHSLPWLYERAKEFDNRPVLIGEIDFLILHPTFGILALEVKGGIPSYDGSSFVYSHNNQKIDPVGQVKRGLFSLTGWLKEKGVQGVKIGFAVAFPEADVKNNPLPPSLTKLITLDKTDLNTFGARIKEIMIFWQERAKVRPLGVEKTNEIINLICPEVDYTPSWQTRIAFDNNRWLKLDLDQDKYLKKLLETHRGVVTGWPGTGKTLVGIALAKQLADSEKQVLFLVFNSPLANYLKNQLKDTPNCHVYTFHQLCSKASAQIGKTVHKHRLIEESKAWFEQKAVENLKIAIEENKIPLFDSLIIDEAQVFDKEWLYLLTNWFGGKKIVVFCDETQVFEFEKSTTLNEIVAIINAPSPYVLTRNHRSPKKVSDLLQEVKESFYQLSNYRDFEPNTLVELPVADPDDELYKVLTKLRKEDVSASDITVLYNKVPPPDFVGFEDYKYRTESIARFRGLESPVVIIYVPVGSGENLLFCAYSRATTRCIVIYDAYETTIHSYGNFGKKLLESKKYPEIRAAADSGYIVNILRQLNITRQVVVSQIVQIEWCFEWGCWIIIQEEEAEAVTKLWLDYLQDVTKDPILYIDSKTRDTFQLYDSMLKNSDDISVNPTVRLYSCSNCRRIAPHKKETGEVGNCILCEYSLPEFNSYIPFEEIEGLMYYENTLSAPKGIMKDEKLRLPVSLIAVGYWNALNTEQKELLSTTAARAGGNLFYRAAVVLTIVDILNTKQEGLIKLDDLSKKYHLLYNNINKLPYKKWKSSVSLALELWANRELINKLSKGVFRRN